MAENQLLNYRRAGVGEPLLLLHGIGGELGVWDPVWDALAEAHDVIAVDLPGFGGSQALPDGVTPTPSALAGVVASFAGELGIRRAHVVGNSLGGWIALELARAGWACSVTALSPAGLWGAPLLGPGAPAVGRANAFVRRLRPALPALLRSRRVRRLALGHVVADPDKVPYAAALRIVRSYARAGAYAATNTAMRQTFFVGGEEISVPVTLAFGERDRLVRPVQLPIVGSRSLILRGCGHIPMWDDPGLVSRLILDGSDAGPQLRERGRAAGQRPPASKWPDDASRPQTAGPQDRAGRQARGA
jgi:pimeloyl-ACP methyl ester carboxylesterase